MTDNPKRVMFPMFERRSDIALTMDKNGKLSKIRYSKPVVYPHNFRRKRPRVH